jgi:hypothetical protein
MLQYWLLHLATFGFYILCGLLFYVIPFQPLAFLPWLLWHFCRTHLLIMNSVLDYVGMNKFLLNLEGWFVRYKILG